MALTDFSRIPPSGGGGSGDGSDSAPSAPPSALEIERTRKARLRAAAAKYHQAITEEASAAAPESSSHAAATRNSTSSSSSCSINSSPQALNNLGLVLQELSSFEAPGSRERAALAAAAAARFRAAARGRPDFERAVYNLGTVLYASAPPAASASSNSSSVPSTPSSSSNSPNPSSQQARAEALADAAQCVALAAALAPAAPVYARSLALVQPFLPLPKLRAGWLLVPDPLPLGSSSSSQQHRASASAASAPTPTLFFLPGSVTSVGESSLIFPSSRERFVARWCVIDPEALRATSPPADAPAPPAGWWENQESGGASQNHHLALAGNRHGSNGNNAYSSSHGASQPSHYDHHHSHARPARIPLSEILSATPSADASLPGPAGAGLHLRFVSRSSSAAAGTAAPPAGCFLVAPSHASAEAWADALCVAGHVARSPPSRGGGSAALARVLVPAVRNVAVAGAQRRPSSSGMAR